MYVCHCGTNIAGKVNPQQVAAFAKQLRSVSIARDYKFMCSDPGQEMIVQDIREYSLNRVVVASCSPRLHEKTFQNACQRADLNPFFFQMTCIREHCAWVTADPYEATLKAKHLVAAAVDRVVHHEALFSRMEKVNPDVLVVGAGISGIQAALDVARGGFNVHLVEKGTSIGGHMAQFDKTFPTLDCAACIGTPKMVDVAQNPNIQLLSYSEIEEVTGYVGNYTVTVKRHPRYIDEGFCTGCGECAKVCPVSVISEWDEGLGFRKAIYRAFPQAVPITYAIDKRDRAPCRAACPANTNVQGYVQLIKAGNYEAAVRLIMEKIPLPGVLGRVCPHPCEAHCRRSEVDEPVAIRDLKRFAADMIDFEKLEIPTIIEKPQQVAVIGSGPAGLTAAFDMRKAGYQVTIFEARQCLGGMLRNGIPDYRLPPAVLDREIGYVLRHGIRVEQGVRLGKDFSLADLRQAGFEATFLGIGVQSGLRLNIPGEAASEGVLDSIQFLREVSAGEKPSIGHHTVVIGGGNVAIDAARVSRRLGADCVSLLYRRTKAEMPAYEEEIVAAREEGVAFHFLCSPVEILNDDGRVRALRCIRNEPGLPDDSGRCRPVPLNGSEFEMPCDTVITAIGQRLDPSWGDNDKGPALSSRNLIAVDTNTLQTSLSDVFAAGDAVSGPASVVDAIAAGHRAAAAMMTFLSKGLGSSDVGTASVELLKAGQETGDKKPSGTWQHIPSNLPIQRRALCTRSDPNHRITGFEEPARGFEEAQAREEAGRCLNCGVCAECMECVRVCETQAINHHQDSRKVELKVGSIILATGYDCLDPTPLGNFGYGRFDEVYTALQFERLNNAVGPTGGKIVMKNGKPPQSVAIVHCVGSRDHRFHEYCSRVCCMYALKYDHLIKDKVGDDTLIFNFYIDMRCYGKGYEEFFQRVQKEGVMFIRGRPAEITNQALSSEELGKLIVVAEDTLIGEVLRVPVDMVVLCTAMEARKDSTEVARCFGVARGKDGFFLEEHPKLGPVSTATDGVFLAGACQGPKDIPDAVSHASGAAAQALALAAGGEVQISPTVSHINPDICIGCQTCIELCAYSAIDFDARRHVSIINETLCKGCGSCAGHCPSGAAQIRHFTEKQIFAEIEGLIGPFVAPASHIEEETVKGVA